MGFMHMSDKSSLTWKLRFGGKVISCEGWSRVRQGRIWMIR